MNLIFAGFGGQGVLTAGLIVGKIGMDGGKNVSWIPSYGSEMRGGTANCNLKISDGKISSPFISNIDVLVAMNMPSVAKFEKNLVPGGTIIANRTLVADHTFRDDVNVYLVDATSISDQLDYPKGANIVMLGGLASSEVIFDKDTLWKGIENFFEMKGKSNPKNLMCYEKGLEMAQKS
ncbi:MAG: 2-oxoacid:acceptor oxidoreductase family protein [Sphaerochaetaceae bacterium]